jgi:hypothetical protein
MTSTAARLGAYALGLVAVFGAAVGIGAVVGPVGSAADDTAAHNTASSDGSHTESPMDASAPQVSAVDHVPDGLQISEGGYTLDLAGEVAAGEATPRVVPRPRS